MNNRCEIIQDLMPSYIDGLVSEGTAAAVEEHIRECGECRAMLESMKADEGSARIPDEMDRKEIDFLRKSRKRSKRAVILGVVLTLLLAGAAACVKMYAIGSEYYGEMACDVQVDGNTMTVGVTAADSVHVIRGLDFTMEDGVAKGKVRAVLPGIYHSSGTFSSADAEDGEAPLEMVTCDMSGTFSFDEEIREVRIGDRIYWSGGRDVSAKASDVFMAGHDYVGDVSANGALVDALGLTEDIGSFYSELETDREPYIWTIVIDEDQMKYNPEYLEKHLRGYGYILIGSVGNLDEAHFRYRVDGKEKVLKVTTEDADKFFGKSVKTCCSDAGALSELMEKAEID